MEYILINTIIINIILIIIMGVCEYKNHRSFILWFCVILIFSFLGFIIYVILGNRLKFKAKKELLIKQKSVKNYLKYTRWYNSYKQNKLKNINIKQNKLITYLQNKFNINLWNNNQIKTFISGESFLKEFINDLKNAKKTINLEFYIFSDDKSGKDIFNVLKEKAKEGIVINVIYDSIGSRKTKKEFWKSLKDNGINVYSFFPGIMFVNLKLNYRNHRKIAIIDGKISYTGGINIRDDHMGKNKKLSPWRDTQIRIVGDATYSLQDIFLNDLAYASGERITKEQIEKYFPKNITSTNNIPLQVLSSGPESSKLVIKNSYINIINNTQKELYIQTPYFIVKKNILQLLIKAKQRGVEIKIIIPKKPDKKLVYAGTLYCLKTLIKNKIQVYLYDGFIHSKVLLSDNVLSIGSCNFDNRSFELNFESTVFIYDHKIINNHKNIIEYDLSNSTLLTHKKYLKLSTQNIFFKIFYELFYRIL